jgi:two-component system, chemotaxis family, sensor kinase CheA
MNPLLEQFLEEARENLKFIEENIESLADADEELLNSIFRAAHTLKGGSGIVGFESVKNITHKAEDLLDLLRSKQIEFHSDMIDALYDAFDEVLNLVEAAEASDDIVDADPQVLEKIVDQLNGLMGKSDEVVEWSLPYTPIEENTLFNTIHTDWLRNATFKLEFAPKILTQESIESNQLYAILFDVDEDCMQWGNDPIYTLSLLEEKLQHIEVSIDETNAKSILSGDGDEEGLKLRSMIIAFVYATFEDIEEALYNFMDDLLITPLSINTLLGANKGEIKHYDFLKDFANKAIPLLNEGNTDELQNMIGQTLELMSETSQEFFMLKRLSNLLWVTEMPDFPKLESCINAIVKGNSCDEQTNDSIKATQNIEDSKEEEDQNEPTSTVAIDESAPTLQLILNQQQERLTVRSDIDTILRIVHVINKVASKLNIASIESEDLTDISDYIERLLTALDQAEVSNETIQETAVEEIAIEKTSANEPVKVESPIPVKETTPVKDTVTTTTIIQETPKKTETLTPQITEVVTTSTEKTKAPEAQVIPKIEPKKDVIGKVVKIDQSSIDHLMSLVGELLVAKNSLPYLADQSLEMQGEAVKRAIMEKYVFINRLTDQLQDLIMGMRMLPISYVFDRYPKLVRDISKNLGKKIKLVQEGKETKLDKNMIEMLADPLIHIVRNSLDHGIEQPSDRESKGKESTGTLTMKAYAQSDKVIVEIIDDGKGIPVDIVVNKVIEKELMTVDQIDALTEEEKVALILLPGLSTAESISEYSGRGVGMDVVKKSIEGFGGNVSIRSKQDEGTTITLTIPVSLAVTTLLHVSFSGLHYGVPMESVNETVKVRHDEITYLNNQPFIYLRGDVIPILYMDELLDRDDLKNKELPIVVLNIKNNLLALVVNDLLGQLDVVQKPLDGILSDHPVLSSTALLGNGQIIMTIDPIGLWQYAEGQKMMPQGEV